MELIDLLLARPKVQSVTVEKNKIVVVANGMSHTYSREYFECTIVPKLNGQAAA